MRKLGIVAAGILLFIGGFVVWWSSQTPTYVHRFRLAIEVEVDGVPRIGSSVIEVHTTDYKVGSAETTGLRSKAFGDAVFLDLGSGRNVIATLGYDLVLLDFHAFRAVNSNLRIEDLPALRGRAPLPDNLIPKLVTFTDLDDPKSARKVGFTEFETVFGPNVHFKSAWVEMTSDPVTRGIEKKLLWWKNPGRPAAEAYRAWGQKFGGSIEPEILFTRRN